MSKLNKAEVLSATKCERVELTSFEAEDQCGRCGAEIVFRPPLPRFYWMLDTRKLCDQCGGGCAAMRSPIIQAMVKALGPGARLSVCVRDDVDGDMNT